MGLISRVSSRTYRNFLDIMKTVNCNYDVDLTKFGDAVKMTVKGQVVTVSGPRGTLKRDFSHLKVELKKTGLQTMRITKWWATMKQKAALRTVSPISTTWPSVSLPDSDTKCELFTRISQPT